MSDQCVGEIRMFAGLQPPEGWELCNGQTLPIAGNEQLFSLLGTLYGGDGRTNFGLPDMRSRVPIGQGRAASGTTYTMAATGGAETVTLTQAQLPPHTHIPLATASPATTGNPTGNLMAATVNSDGAQNQDAMYLQKGAPLVTEFPLNGNAVSPAGSSLPHDNIMPCTPVNFIIALTGVYPNFQ